MRCPFLFLCLVVVAPADFGADQPASAESLMRQVAERFEQASQARRTYVYKQVVKSSLVKPSGEIIARQRREYAAVPSADRTAKTLTFFEGFYVRGKKKFNYTKPKDPSVPGGVDHELLEGLTDGLVDDKSSRDGIPKRLFPLTSQELQYYRFRLLGESEYQGRRLYQVAFEPADKEFCIHVGADEGDDCGARAWKGEAWIDAEDLQPVRVTTELGKKVPMAVRMFLGTNVGQLGFSVTWRRVAPGVWFPVTYGTEFQVNVLWGYRRTVTLSMDSSDFRIADVKSTIEYETVAAPKRDCVDPKMCQQDQHTTSVRSGRP